MIFNTLQRLPVRAYFCRKENVVATSQSYLPVKNKNQCSHSREHIPDICFPNDKHTDALLVLVV